MMAPLTFLIASILMPVSQTVLKGGQVEPLITLSQYIDSLHWDSKKSGPLIAINAAELYIDDDAPKTWAGFEQKLVKSGSVNVVAQNWQVALDDSDLPNPYQALSQDQKLIFLLANMDASEIAKLTSEGISAAELRGEERQALLSMLPKPLTYFSGMADGESFSGSSPMETLPDHELEHVKLQFRKGLTVTFGAVATRQNGQSATSLSSLNYGAGGPVPAVHSSFARRFGRGPAYPGRIVESKERKSQISWGDPRLSKAIRLTSSSRLSEVVSAIRAETGIEIYADVRISGLTVNTVGASASAGDLLRGLALAVGGAVRQVGSAYVLTSSIDGTATEETKLRAHLAIGQLEIQDRLVQWEEAVGSHGFLESLAFSPDDRFQGRSISADMIGGRRDSFEAGWVPLSRLPASIQAAVSHSSSQGRHSNDAVGPVPELEGKAKLGSELGYRFVLPDGRPLEYQRFNALNWKPASMSDVNSKESGIPIDPSKLAPGSAVAIGAGDPATVTRLCADIKNSGMSEVWLDSTSPSAIEAAQASGLTVDLIVHPWSLLKGERNMEPDKNVLGMTGSQLSKLPGARYDSAGRRYNTYADSLSPGASEVERHWSRLVGSIPKKGIHRIVLLDTEPGGYQTPEKESHGVVFGFGGSQSGSLLDAAPGLFEFGYTGELRMEFLRKHQIDPVDLIPPVIQKLGPPIPFFEHFMVPRKMSPYASVYFPVVQPPQLEHLIHEWQVFRSSFMSQKIDDLAEKLSLLCDSVLMEGQAPGDRFGARFAARTVKPGPWEGLPDWKSHANVSFISFGPENTEQVINDQTELAWKPYIPANFPFCFDLREVSPDRVPTYLRYLLRPKSIPK